LLPAPGRSGHHVCRHYDRHARCVAGSGYAVGGVTPAPWTVCPRNLARIAPRDHTPLGKNRGGTPEGELPPPVQGAAPHPKVRRSALRLPAFHFPSFSEAKKPTETTRPPPLPRSVCSRFALHVTEIGGPAGEGACGEGILIHFSPRAGRSRGAKRRGCGGLSAILSDADEATAL